MNILARLLWILRVQGFHFLFGIFLGSLFFGIAWATAPRAKRRP
jgi:hypothetical protein